MHKTHTHAHKHTDAHSSTHTLINAYHHISTNFKREKHIQPNQKMKQTIKQLLATKIVFMIGMKV